MSSIEKLITSAAELADELESTGTEISTEEVLVALSLSGLTLARDKKGRASEAFVTYLATGTPIPEEG